jgi:Spy/CpxP family protein refolding chaperone
MRRIVLASTLFLLAGVQSVWAQQQQPGSDPIGDNFIPPELIMQHQQEIGLSPDQKSFITAELQKAQTKFSELQWQLSGEVETMASLVKQERIDEAQTLAQLDKILNLEREIKRTHIALVIRIKNRLSAEQQARLQEMKHKSGPR